MARKKSRRAWLVRTKDERTYRIVADQLEYDDDEKVVYFKKELKGQINLDKTNIWVVAFFKYEDIQCAGLEGFIARDKLPFFNSESKETS